MNNHGSGFFLRLLAQPSPRNHVIKAAWRIAPTAGSRSAQLRISGRQLITIFRFTALRIYVTQSHSPSTSTVSGRAAYLGCGGGRFCLRKVIFILQPSSEIEETPTSQL